MGKRGRKPNPEKNKNYFSEEQEEAVVAYLNSDDKEERDLIFNTKLKRAFEKMIESIIRRYKLFIPDEEYIDTFNDTLSFLLTKAEKFEPGKYKAYSYYGTICKNYLIGRIQNRTKTLMRNPSYEMMESEFKNNIYYSYETEKNSKIPSEIVSNLIERIGTMISNPKENDLKEDEIKLGMALKNLLENWDYVISTDGSNKLNKNAILLFLRDETGFNTKGIRTNLKKYKDEFLSIKDSLID